MPLFDRRKMLISVALLGTTAACAQESDSALQGGASADPVAQVGEAACDVKFESSFDAIQKLVFERHGCTAAACHGEGKVGGLDLRDAASYDALVDVRSTNSSLQRVQPGTAAESYLYQKLQAGTSPGSIQISGSPMPIGGTPLTAKELEAVRLWIIKGAPRTGNVGDQTKGTDVGKLLDACLPPVTAEKVKPLEPPPPEDGIQMVLPTYAIKADSETDTCTPFAYDFTDKVPAAYKDATRRVMFTNGLRIRQDALSHHLVIWDPVQDLNRIKPNDPEWTCRGGPTPGKQCNAQLGSRDCGALGVCAGKATNGALCGVDTTAFGSGSIDDIMKVLLGTSETKLTPQDLDALINIVLSGSMPGMLANAQAPQQYIPPMEGVYEEMPIRGILWFNSHAFNLTQDDSTLDARINFFYAKKRERQMKRVYDYSKNDVAKNQPPFTRKTYCQKHVIPRGNSLAMLTGHTHRRGEAFWVNDSSGKRIYESLNYNDPPFKRWDPPQLYNQANNAERTLEYCATFNNGLTADGAPDLKLVTRASNMPDRQTCKPVACTAGRITAACTTNRDCDSAPGANDGQCDACGITTGQRTENEMFVLMGAYVLPPKK